MEHQGDPNISLPTPISPGGSSNGSATASRASSVVVDPTIYPGGSRSLASISLHAFCLGISLSTGLFGTIYLVYSGQRIWRLTEFIATLSLFHFLEFFTTARWNTSNAKVSSYLLLSNGAAYLTAHVSAIIEIIVTSLFFPELQDLYSNKYTIGLGLLLVIGGQTIRSIAMAQAGVSFNHIPAKSKKNDHVLVTWGLYSYFRHPSYFGYFFFAIGTQILVGNKICSFAYLVVLWFFFKDRIQSMLSLCCVLCCSAMLTTCSQMRKKIWSSSLVLIINATVRESVLVYHSSDRFLLYTFCFLDTSLFPFARAPPSVCETLCCDCQCHFVIDNGSTCQSKAGFPMHRVNLTPRNSSRKQRQGQTAPSFSFTNHIYPCLPRICVKALFCSAS